MNVIELELQDSDYDHFQQKFPRVLRLLLDKVVNTQQDHKHIVCAIASFCNVILELIGQFSYSLQFKLCMQFLRLADEEGMDLHMIPINHILNALEGPNLKLEDLLIFVKFLLEHGVDLNEHHRCATVQLYSAIDFFRDASVINLLQDHGVELLDMFDNTIAQILFVITVEHSPLTTRTLVRRQPNIFRKVIESIIEEGDEVVKILLEEGMDVNSRGSFGETLIHSACAEDSFGMKVLNVLLSHGADVNIPSNNGYTPLMSTASQHNFVSKKYERLKLLLKYGANKYAKEYSGNMTAFMYACEQGIVMNMELLYTGHEHINDVNYKGQSALMLACVSRKVDAVKWLVQRGADVDMTDNTGKTVLQYAATNSCIKEYIRNVYNHPHEF